MDKFNSLSSITLLNWNANGILTKSSAFIQFLDAHKIDIACITETHLAPHKNFKIPHYICYRNDRPSNKAAGWVAILVKRSISHAIYPTQSDNTLELIALQITLSHNKTLNIISEYRSPNKLTNFQQLAFLFNSNNPTIMLGDLNAKNTAWGCNITIPPGSALQNIISVYNLDVHAPNEPTHYSYNKYYLPDILNTAISKNLHFQLFSKSLVEL